MALDFPAPLRILGRETCTAFAFLIAIHDLGKISDAFRAQIADRRSPPRWARHWELSEVLFDEHDKLLARTFNQCDKKHRNVRRQLYKAVAWHHGRVPSGGEWTDQIKKIGSEAIGAAADFLEQASSLFGRMDLSAVTLKQATTISWLLNGLTSRADWLASNTQWFPFQAAPVDLEDYWQTAQKRAQVAAAESGLAGASPAKSLNATSLTDGYPLRPMQAAAKCIQLPAGPVLALLEDATGSGKTEAALILAHRMMQAGKGKGIYFALPTTATADSMFSRMKGQIDQLFRDKPYKPSLTLAHGRAWLNDEFRQVRGARDSHSPDASCAEWLATDKRRSLFAEIGVGTVDQALLGVLPTRFQAMRLAALSERIVIVDEAAFGPYMAKEAEALLEAHATFGGSAIVMTATLPLDLRRKYANSFAKGAGSESALLNDESWPVLSLVSRAGATQRAVDPVAATCRTVKVRRLGSKEDALSLLAEAAADGAACIWVRNAVDEAIASAKELQERGIETDLLHARFTLHDRVQREADMLRFLGKNREGRPGRVLVSTQVIESSLDLDADVMVTDLAPIDNLVQRAGRLWRHMDKRPVGTRPVPEPVLHVVSPDPDQVDSNWLEPVIGKGAWVYPLDHQWRTADILFREGLISTPDRLRALMEAVHGVDAQLKPVPDAIEEAENQAQGERHALRSSAGMKVIALGSGFSSVINGLCDDDPSVGTRLGEPQVPLKLYRMENGKPVWWSGGTDKRDMVLSTVQVREGQFQRVIGSDQKGNVPEEAAGLTQGWKEWERKEGLVARVNDDGSIEGLSSVYYDAEAGLQMDSR